MLRYRVAYDHERGYFVLPALAAIVSPEDTFASRTAALRIAQAKNAHSVQPTANAALAPADASRQQQNLLRRESA
jgi:hypothetical protein